MLDILQWRHPLVIKPSSNKPLTPALLSNEERKEDRTVVPGCPGTLLKTITASGLAADTFHIWSALGAAFNATVPFQAAPTRLGQRVTPPIWDFTLGWSYTFQACPSNFLDCFFLPHSPCPSIDIDITNPPRSVRVDASRLSESNIESMPSGYKEAVGYDIDQPTFSIGTLDDEPATQTLYSYIFRPNYRVRRHVQQRVEMFDMGNEPYAVMHVRRGDILLHGGYGRAYLSILTYVRVGRPMMDALGVRTILLLTDSQTAIEEALRCETEHGDVCRGLKWKFVEKRRWRAAEGGWENPFPSGNATQEFLEIQHELTLVQHGAMMVMGESGYGYLISRYMCCGFPLSPRGHLPRRCICPPRIELHQAQFNCEEGNLIHCNDKDPGGNILLPLNDPQNMAGANFSLTKKAYRENPEVKFIVPGNDELHFALNDQSLLKIALELKDLALKALVLVCEYRNFERNMKKCK
mmetsp:Transcript_32219/g.32845  ORF Transcript_32219/g.32845 Transcript_32219/m.32845 type:complete len:466 (-) Transcript_32219:29-1426(-)